MQKTSSIRTLRRMQISPCSHDNFFQPKLIINQPNDIYEQEADAIADKVMRMQANDNQNTFFKPANISSTQRKCSHCEEEEKLQMKGEGNADNIVPSSVYNVLNSTAQPLDNSTKNFMESRFGYDFGNVQIHNDSKANQSSAEINALAYTHENHVVFSEGQYQPHLGSGKYLLAHELAHVIQQNGSKREDLKKQNFANGYKDKVSESALPLQYGKQVQRTPYSVPAWDNSFIKIDVSFTNENNTTNGGTDKSGTSLLSNNAPFKQFCKIPAHFNLSIAFFVDVLGRKPRPKPFKNPIVSVLLNFIPDNKKAPQFKFFGHEKTSSYKQGASMLTSMPGNFPIVTSSSGWLFILISMEDPTSGIRLNYVDFFRLEVFYC